ncbi:hypothetical protein [Endozoicomonas euniceicola]|uniref:Clp ATPase C-terminal domain-containing protein n=1 Tax=Endozoicomonas euniceicola TaxID=1234143 RepID=A0ABY6GVU3_9GAMM|nr:hypothetical protein [Endozoicomonas euniceicola]UYM16882.1 hypothetical protein NX720_02850 [Endozoicomonas euniceicola]UYM16884.1 hypothetical protein NX720_02860 [Endozoicomonas euniceicola]UYM16889.1 hypothetical protein NX720_02885 [Endozoicomonas euniceicola]
MHAFQPVRHDRVIGQDEVMKKLAQVGFDPVYGARPLKRAIQRNLENPLAEAILSGRYAPGDTIRAIVSDDKISFTMNEHLRK